MATADATANGRPVSRQAETLVLSERASRFRRLVSLAGRASLLLITSLSVFAVLFIFYYIGRDAIPFFQIRGLKELFTGVHWYPSREPAEFGALPLFFGSGIVTFGCLVLAAPLGVLAAVCLSDVLPFAVRQFVKPVIEILAAIPSVAYGFFALVVLAPLFQDRGGSLLAAAAWVVGVPVGIVVSVVVTDLISQAMPLKARLAGRIVLFVGLAAACASGLSALAQALGGLEISSGTNSLNVSVILAIMALPTVVSVSEDALQAVGRELREGSYALGATRAETLLKVVIPAASSGIMAAVILGIMRAIGETMVVWMASGNAAQVPTPWYNFLAPVRTLTATIAGDMGEADHVTGSARYHVLFALALCLLVTSFALNLASEWAVRRTRKKMRGE